MKRFLIRPVLIASFLLVFVGGVEGTEAGERAGTTACKVSTPKEYFDAANVVFVGQIVNIKTLEGSYQMKQSLITRSQPVEVLVKVTERIKGAIPLVFPETFFSLYYSGRDMANAKVFVVNKSYLIFAFARSVLVTEPDHPDEDRLVELTRPRILFTTSPCDGTVDLEIPSAKKTLEEVKKITWLHE